MEIKPFGFNYFLMYEIVSRLPSTRLPGAAVQTVQRAAAAAICLRLTACELCQGPLVWQMENLGRRLTVSFCRRNEVSRQANFPQTGVFLEQTIKQDQKWRECVFTVALQLRDLDFSHIMFYSHLNAWSQKIQGVMFIVWTQCSSSPETASVPIKPGK